MPAYAEEDMQLAMLVINNGFTIRKAATRNGVPESSLRSRVKGSRPHKHAHKHQQRLSPYQEQQLTSWLVLQDSLGMGLTHAQIRTLVTSILVAAGDEAPLGRRWIPSFIQ